MSKYYIDQENVFYLEYVLPITTQCVKINQKSLNLQQWEGIFEIFDAKVQIIEKWFHYILTFKAKIYWIFAPKIKINLDIFGATFLTIFQTLCTSM